MGTLENLENRPSPANQFIIAASLVDYQDIVQDIAVQLECSIAEARRRVLAEVSDLCSEACAFARIDFASTQSEVVPSTGVGGLRVSSAEQANAFAAALFAAAAGFRSDLPARQHRRFRIGVHGGPGNNTLGILDLVQRFTTAAPEGGVLVSDFVFGQLPSNLRSLYCPTRLHDDPAEPLDGYRWVPSPAERGLQGRRTQNGQCFIVMPYGGSRGEEVLEHYIKPACQQLELVPCRADWNLSPQIVHAMLSSLQNDRFVVAYLGCPPWNANVMLEIGVRLAVKKPLLILREAAQNGEETLPFDLRDYRVMMLPDPAAQERRPAIVAQTVGEIANTIRDRLSQPDLWRYPHATATARFMLDDERSEYTESSQAANDVFDTELVGQSVANFVKGLAEVMAPSQHEAFVREQERLFVEVLGGHFLGGQRRIPTATIPVVINKHATDPNLIGRGYLPVIVRYWKQGGELLLRIVYLDVTGVMVEKPTSNGGTVFFADLGNVAKATS
jgi:hypothetical protein